MAKFRLLFFLLTILVVGIFGYFLSFYAKGYRLDTKTFKFLPNGILVLKSNPDGAQIFINGELKTATNATINLAPNTYDISVRKDGYLDWNKRLTVQKEIVTEADAHLFRAVPSLSAVTFTGIIGSPLPSPDFTKIAYIIPPTANGNSTDQAGLWIMETINLPLGFSREPRRITDGDLNDASLLWSPDSREILLTTKLGVYLLDIGRFTTSAQRVNIQSLLDKTLADWKVEEQTRLTAKINPLPDKLSDILERQVESLVFSPDESKILYTASGNATIPKGIFKELPGASTQPEERDIKAGRTYVYDLKEDKNFLIDDDAKSLSIETWKPSDKRRRMFWFASSRHLVSAEENKIIIMDMDGTNRQVVYSGNYVSPNTLPAPSVDRLLILTNLGANSTPPNIYTLSLK